MNRLWGLVLGALVAGTLVAACGGGSSKTIKTDNGDVKVSTGGSLPSDFPSDFPIYKGADYKGGVQSSQSGVNGFFASWETDDSVDKVKSYYDDQFKDGPWTTSTTVSSSGTNGWFVQKKDDATMVGYVTVAGADGKTQITAGVGKNPDGSSGSATEGPSSSADTPESGDGSEPTADPNATLPAEVDLPSDYPSDRVPLPDGARVTGASSVSTGGQKSYVLEFYTKDDPDKVIDYFKDELPKHDWAQVLISNSGGASLGSWSNGDEAVTVTTSTSDVAGYTTVSMVIGVAAT